MRPDEKMRSSSGAARLLSPPLARILSIAPALRLRNALRVDLDELAMTAGRPGGEADRAALID